MVELRISAEEIGDDSPLSFIEDRGDDPRLEEVSEMLHGLNEDERIDLVALALVGREDFTLKEWDLKEWNDAIAEAEDRIAEGGADFVVQFLARRATDGAAERRNRRLMKRKD